MTEARPGMTSEEWVAALRPHWACANCQAVFVTIPPPDGWVCCWCKGKPLDGPTCGVCGAKEGLSRPTPWQGWRCPEHPDDGVPGRRNKAA